MSGHTQRNSARIPLCVSERLNIYIFHLMIHLFISYLYMSYLFHFIIYLFLFISCLHISFLFHSIVYLIDYSFHLYLLMFRKQKSPRSDMSTDRGNIICCWNLLKLLHVNFVHKCQGCGRFGEFWLFFTEQVFTLPL